jgi:hypothetical protein
VVGNVTDLEPGIGRRENCRLIVTGEMIEAGTEALLSTQELVGE